MQSFFVGACNPFTLKVVPEKHELIVVLLVAHCSLFDLVPLLILSVLLRVSSVCDTCVLSRVSSLCVTHVSCQGLVLCVTHVPCQGLVFLCVTDVSSGGLVLCVWGMCPSGTLYLGVFKAVTTLLFVQESPLSTSYYTGLRAVCLGNVSGCRIFSSLYFECLIPFSCRQWGFCKATFCESGERSLRVTLLWLV